MILKVVKYGNPVLRKKGARIESVTAEIKRLIADMFETMYAYKGVGLAAQQVGHPVQLTVIDVRGVTIGHRRWRSRVSRWMWLNSCRWC